MRPETAGALYDMDLACGRIGEAARGKSFEEFSSDWILQSAVERQFGILGEALVRIRDLEPLIFDRFPEPAKMIGLRNILIHGYDQVDPRVLWSIITEKLGDLGKLLAVLLEEAKLQGL